MDAQYLIHEARAAARQNNPELARTLLTSVLKTDHQNAQAWLAMSEVVDNPKHAIQCLERVLKIEPSNSLARQKLSQLTSQVERSQTQPTPPSAPVPANVKPVKQPALPPKPQTRREPPKNKSGRWIEISLLVVAVLCACAVIPLLIGQVPALTQSGPTPTVEDVTLVIRENARAANQEDIELYMDTIHPRASGRSTVRSSMVEIFERYDLSYKVGGLEVLEIKGNEAQVAFNLTTRKVRGPAFRDNWLSGVMILRLDDGRWKIYNQKIDEVKYLD